MKTREMRTLIARNAFPTLEYHMKHNTNYFELCDTAINQLCALVQAFNYRNPQNGASASRNLYYYLIKGYRNLPF